MFLCGWSVRSAHTSGARLHLSPRLLFSQLRRRCVRSRITAGTMAADETEKYIPRHCPAYSTISPPRFGYPLRAAVSVSDLPHNIFNRSRGISRHSRRLLCFVGRGVLPRTTLCRLVDLARVSRGRLVFLNVRRALRLRCSSYPRGLWYHSRGGCRFSFCSPSQLRRRGGCCDCFGLCYLGAPCLSRCCRSHRGRRWVGFSALFAPRVAGGLLWEAWRLCRSSSPCGG